MDNPEMANSAFSDDLVMQRDGNDPKKEDTRTDCSVPVNQEPVRRTSTSVQISIKSAKRPESANSVHAEEAMTSAQSADSTQLAKPSERRPKRIRNENIDPEIARIVMAVDGDSETLPGGKQEQQIQAMKTEAEEIVAFYKSLREKNDHTSRKITGLNSEKEAVRQRIRALLNKTTTARGPDYDAYQMMRKTSRTYEPIDARRTSTHKIKSVSEAAEDDAGGQLPSSISLTVNTETGQVSEEAE